MKKPIQRQSQGRKNLVGMALCGIAAFFFSLVAVIVKFTPWPKALILEARSIVQVGFCTFILAYLHFVKKMPNVLLGPPDTRVWLLARSICYWGFIFTYWQCLTYLPVGDATALAYTSPLVASILGFTWLGEPFHWSFIVFMVFNISGMMLVCQPGFLFESSNPLSPFGVLLALTAACVSGLLGPFVRKSREAHWSTVEVYAHVGSSVFFTPIFLLIQSLTTDEPVIPEGPVPWLQLITISILGFSGLGCLTIGFQYAHASVASLIMYAEIPVSYLFQAFLFGQEVDWKSLLGCALILSSGVASVSKQFSKAKGTGKTQGESAPLLKTEQYQKYGQEPLSSKLDKIL